MSSVSNKITTVKHFSALAQLVQLYAEKGITSTAELSAKTGFSDRHIWRARAELRQAENKTGTSAKHPPVLAQDTRVPPTDARVSPLTPASVTPASAPPDAGVSLTPSPSPLKEKSPPVPPLKKIHPSPKKEERAREKVSFAKPNSLLPTNFLASHPQGPPPAWRGSVLVVSAEQHQAWKQMFPGYDLKLGYPIADAECAERGKANGAAILHAQKKLGYLASDFAAEQVKGLSPEEAKEERLHAWLRSQNPHYVDARRG